MKIKKSQSLKRTKTNELKIESLLLVIIKNKKNKYTVTTCVSSMITIELSV